MCILRNENDPTAKIFNNMEINYNVVKDEYKSIIGKDDFSDESSESNDGSEFEEVKSPQIAKTKSKSNKKSKTPVLDNFGKDLTSMAENDELDPIIGSSSRSHDIENIPIIANNIILKFFIIKEFSFFNCLKSNI